ncbi:MAG: DUF1559 domain-containing protein [Planctomycetaceae bacterium]|nr:DUF1559 domain-containing protein [Planctomycetaceae bacterium]
MSKLDWLVAIAVVAIVIALVIPAVQRPTESFRPYCKNNLKAIGLALHNYHDKYKCFPPTYVVGADGRRWHSWRVFLLPFLDGQKLHKQYRFDEPWDSDNNRRLWNQCPPYFRCPGGIQQTTAANYVAVVGPKTMWSGQEPVKLSQNTDGGSNTIFLVEISPGIPWLAPIDVNEEEAIADLGDHGRFSVPKHEPVRHVLMVDGSVRGILKEESSPEMLWAMLTRDGREEYPNGKDRTKVKKPSTTKPAKSESRGLVP